MEIVKEHRWFAPLLSVLLVCILGIGLYAEVQQTQKNHKNTPMQSLSWSGNSSAPSYGDRMGTHNGSNRTSPIFVAAHGQPSWKEIMPTPLPASQMKQAEQARNNVATGKKKLEVQHSKSAILPPPTTIYFTKTKMLTQDDKALSTWSYPVSAKELLLLQKIVMAEAEGEPYEGKVAVANVVLNRLRSAPFPDTIQAVIYQKAQFSPVANGRLRRVQPNQDSIRAVTAALNGHKAVPDNTCFFLSLTLAQDLTVHHSRTKVKTIGHHTFYK
ncbi:MULTISPECIES: cell wall hydrolase [Paenibacillus]|uniref:Cell wall hydrolase n=1 Tax=Paenibacillus polymyxa TaxID=1406 RepID=A0AAP4EA34_PAEPO|nr:cell wall hydrolase [Paenibacillus polymyxa]MDH2330276.1 cell wall hydrolase [Paenibacillus polymyxa]